MKILQASQIRAADAYTIAHEPVSSLSLMQRAAAACFHWLRRRYHPHRHTFYIFCGSGNNGGDGLQIGALLHDAGYAVQLYAPAYHHHKASADFLASAAMLAFKRIPLHLLHSSSDFPVFSPAAVLIDALFGSGFNRPLAADSLQAALIQYMNQSERPLISIDIPSGLFCDDNSQNPLQHIVRATHTLTFELPKLALLLPQYQDFSGEWHLLPIGLHPQFIAEAPTSYYYSTAADLQTLLLRRKKFAHKGDFGQVCLAMGSFGKIGAALLAAKGCLRSGAGLLTMYVPACGYGIVQGGVPEAMCNCSDATQPHYLHGNSPDTDKYAVVGIGCGIGTAEPVRGFLEKVLEQKPPRLLLDADALNIMAAHRYMLEQLPPHSILTPHPKEFERLVGKKWKSDEEKLQWQRDFARQHQAIVVLKGAHTAIALPDGTVYFNSSGNAGMAKGGSGDVLSGIICGLWAQGYEAATAARLGVYLHGRAGDWAAQQWGQEAMTASDIAENLSNAFWEIKK